MRSSRSQQSGHKLEAEGKEATWAGTPEHQAQLRAEKQAARREYENLWGRPQRGW